MGNVLKYKDEIVRSMKYLASMPNTVFLGQSVGCPGNAIYKTLEEAQIDHCQRLELPVVEELQLGMSMGLALTGYLPVSIFPRMDFLICAMNQLVNHLDKYDGITRGEFCPKVIIRTCIGSTRPLYPGIQHCSDYTDGLKNILKNVEIFKLETPENVFPAYRKAVETKNKSTILVEIGDLF